MKRRAVVPEEAPAGAVQDLAQVLAKLSDPGEVESFLRDLCTPAELEALADRWRVVPLLIEGIPYREIHDRTAVSVTTVGRIARFLHEGYGGYAAALETIGINTDGIVERTNKDI
ncbi:MAG: DNA-binding transcriptional regulator [Xanthomonadales bacterium]|nr:DNA-binding transcriptional regulator [Xanthomonadales bacterium]